MHEDSSSEEVTERRRYREKEDAKEEEREERSREESEEEEEREENEGILYEIFGDGTEYAEEYGEEHGEEMEKEGSEEEQEEIEEKGDGEEEIMESLGMKEAGEKVKYSVGRIVGLLKKNVSETEIVTRYANYCIRPITLRMVYRMGDEQKRRRVRQMQPRREEAVEGDLARHGWESGRMTVTGEGESGKWREELELKEIGKDDLFVLRDLRARGVQYQIEVPQPEGGESGVKDKELEEAKRKIEAELAQRAEEYVLERAFTVSYRSMMRKCIAEDGVIMGIYGREGKWECTVMEAGGQVRETLEVARDLASGLRGVVRRYFPRAIGVTGDGEVLKALGETRREGVIVQEIEGWEVGRSSDICRLMRDPVSYWKELLEEEKEEGVMGVVGASGHVPRGKVKREIERAISAAAALRELGKEAEEERELLEQVARHLVEKRSLGALGIGQFDGTEEILRKLEQSSERGDKRRDYVGELRELIAEGGVPRTKNKKVQFVLEVAAGREYFAKGGAQSGRERFKVKHGLSEAEARELETEWELSSGLRVRAKGKTMDESALRAFLARDSEERAGPRSQKSVPEGREGVGQERGAVVRVVGVDFERDTLQTRTEGDTRKRRERGERKSLTSAHAAEQALESQETGSYVVQTLKRGRKGERIGALVIKVRERNEETGCEQLCAHVRVAGTEEGWEVGEEKYKIRGPMAKDRGSGTEGKEYRSSEEVMRAHVRGYMEVVRGVLGHRRYRDTADATSPVDEAVSRGGIPYYFTLSQKYPGKVQFVYTPGTRRREMYLDIGRWGLKHGHRVYRDLDEFLLFVKHTVR